MRNRILVTLLCAGSMTLAASLFLAPEGAGGQERPRPDWSAIQIVTYNSGLTGFFDPRDGKYYVYDGNLEKCVIIRQFEKLGEPMQGVKN